MSPATILLAEGRQLLLSFVDKMEPEVGQLIKISNLLRRKKTNIPY